MSTNRGSIAATVMNGKIYVIGGESGSVLFDTVEVYDPNGNWSLDLLYLIKFLPQKLLP